MKRYTSHELRELAKGHHTREDNYNERLQCLASDLLLALGALDIKLSDDGHFILDRTWTPDTSRASLLAKLSIANTKASEAEAACHNLRDRRAALSAQLEALAASWDGPLPGAAEQIRAALAASQPAVSA